MKKIIVTSTVLSCLLLSSCATNVHRGVVAMKISDTQAHVCLGNEEVNVGDSVTLFRNVCHASPDATPKTPAQTKNHCEKTFIAEGKVVELLNKHYSVASFPTGIDVREGDVVERGRS
jgi:hypothetical protein